MGARESRLGIKRDLEHTIALLTEEIKRLLDVFQREMVREEWRDVDTQNVGSRP
jgi:hypothetical protein